MSVRTLRTRSSGMLGAVERTVDRGRCRRRVRIDRARRVEVREHVLEPNVGLARIRRCGRPVLRRVGLDLRGRRGGHGVRERVAVEARVVDDGGGDRLRDDALHQLHDRALLRDAVLVGVVRLELVAQVPVADQALARREPALAVLAEDVVHPQVVAGDVGIGARLSGARGRGSSPGIRLSNRWVSRTSAHVRRS